MSDQNQTAQTGQMGQGFLGSMQTTVVGMVRSFTRYEIDAATKGGSIWVTSPNTGMNPDVLGEEIIKIKMPHAMFDQQREKLEQGLIQIPGMFEILAQITMAGGNKAALTAISIRPHLPEPAPKAAGTQTTTANTK